MTFSPSKVYIIYSCMHFLYIILDIIKHYDIIVTLMDLDHYSVFINTVSSQTSENMKIGGPQLMFDILLVSSELNA